MLILLLTTEDLNAADRLTLLYRKYNGLLYNEAMSLLHIHEDAEDAVADVFEALLNRGRVPSLDEQGVKALLITMLKRSAYRIFSRRIQTQEHGEEDYPDGCAMESVADTAVPPELLLSVQDAVAGLPADEREALILFVYYGYTTAEIAEMKGIKQDTVQKRIKRARSRLIRPLKYDR